MQHQLQFPTVHRVLGPRVAGLKTAGFVPDLFAVLGEEAVLLCGHTNLRQTVTQAKIDQLTNRVGLNVDPDAQRTQLTRRLEHLDWHTELVTGQSESQSGDPATGDQDWIIGHGAPVCAESS